MKLKYVISIEECRDGLLKAYRIIGEVDSDFGPMCIVDYGGRSGLVPTSRLFETPEDAWADFLQQKREEYDLEAKNAASAIERANAIVDRIRQLQDYLEYRAKASYEQYIQDSGIID